MTTSGSVQSKLFGAADVRRVSTDVPAASLRHICRVLNVPRAALYQSSARSSMPVNTGTVGQDHQVTGRIRELIHVHPTYGYRRIWALLRFGDQLLINRKRVYGLMRRKRWLVCQRQVTPKPRVKRLRSVAQRRNER